MKFQLTTQGKTLQSSLQAGKTLTFTKVEGGSTYSQNPEALLAVQSKKQTLQLNEVVIDSESEKAKLSMTLTNIGITEGYDLKQIGIYAKTEDTDEILFIVGQDSKGETVPAITDKEVEFDYSLWFSYDNSYEINLSVSDNDFVKKTMYDSDQKKVNQRIELLEEPEFDDTGEVEGITDRASLLSSFVSKMPMVKFLRNIKAGFKLALYAGEIVNDCVTDNSALPLSAAQGKALMDLYTVLNTKLNNDLSCKEIYDFNAYVANLSPGFYTARIPPRASGNPNPDGGSTFTLINIINQGSDGIIIAVNHSTSKIYHAKYANGSITWSSVNTTTI